MVYIKLLFQELKVQNVFSPIAPMKDSTADQREGEARTGGHEATAIQVSGATGMYATIKIVIFLNSPYHFYTGSLSTGASTAATKFLASAGETSIYITANCGIPL